ncbi:MAG TPA: hypothetical protein VF463_05350 [Sphingobium sp.]
MPGPEHPAFAQYLFRFHYANGSMMPALMMELVRQRFGATGPNAAVETAYRLVEERLGEAPWFAGGRVHRGRHHDGLCADDHAALLGRDISDSPNLLAWLRRIGERPAYRTAMQKAEPDRMPILT